MRIAIDIREACREKRAGKGVWTRYMTEALLADTSHEYVLFTDTEPPAEFRASEATIMIFEAPGWRWHLQAASWLKKANIDMFLATTSYLVPVLLPPRIPFSVVVHDLIAFRSEPHQRKAVFLERLLLPRVIRKAKSIIVTTESAKKDLIGKFPSVNEKHIYVVGAAPERASVEQVGEGGDIILSLGTLCPRKNQLGLIHAYDALHNSLKKRFRLVLAGGRGWQDDEIVQAAQRTPGVEWKDYVSDRDLERLWRDTAVFAFPSFYEGFGLPLLEAFQRGVPTLTGNRSSLPEVAGNAAVLVDPADTIALTKALERLLTDESLRQELREKGQRRAAEFSWSKTARFVEQALRNAV